ncbi:hypothetical protein PFISCL1PPCAC_28615 [Pristionchus fissidentatus]|uniref:Uncharacterized protein n=1 Tax=Pristionchus fissidentatus TaxID=1538716 RepID=A0AAV5X3H2_9BILA|nr:hypothetical protein PFISCL1PPCAC_6963 [Pristionchus fissidentatus]GMT37318.1 hypothetical protein PFISCL1PPCAC_28615 [Pristionchus fissidentatus]
MSRCGLPGGTFLRRFNNYEISFPDTHFRANIEKIDDNTYRVISSANPPTDEETKRLCDSFLWKYGGFPVLKIDGNDKEVPCCVSDEGLDRRFIVLICLFGFFTLLSVFACVFCVVWFRRWSAKYDEEQSGAQTISTNKPPSVPANRKEEEPWSTDLTVEHIPQTPLPPAYTSVFFDNVNYEEKLPSYIFNSNAAELEEKKEPMQ